MSRKEEAVKMMKSKMSNDSFYTYKEIAEITGYHPKYLLKLKKEILNGTISMEHGNKNRKPINTISEEEKEKAQKEADDKKLNAILGCMGIQSK